MLSKRCGRVIPWRLDRLGRNLADLIRTVNDLEEREIGFVSLTEQINTQSPSGRQVFYLFGSLSEFERALICERTLASLKAARARGRSGGRPAKLGAAEVAMVRQLMADRNGVHTAVTFPVDWERFVDTMRRQLTHELMASHGGLTVAEFRETIKHVIREQADILLKEIREERKAGDQKKRIHA